MSNSPSRADLLASIGRFQANIQRISTDIAETVSLTRKMLESSRALLREADDVMIGGARSAGRHDAHADRNALRDRTAQAVAADA